ncbi:MULTISPECIES: cytochrome c oxidase subunit II [Spirulina sp. CCY15215]|uniref:cytochrome c oxidase subunit II n=1 Tax=Spirulina sp. CCY15215 TaxID=2767591 RepID=UPI0019521C05|nr:cytochrome c oxidase subunit II [Spirulina major]
MAKEKETVPSSLITLTIGLAVAGISLWYGQNNGLFPEQVSEQAPLVDNLFNLMTIIGTALFLIVEGAIIFAVVKFRHREGDETDANYVEGNLPLEIFWTAIPTFIVIGLGIYSVQVYNEMGGFDTVGQVAHHHQGQAVEVADMPLGRMNSLLAVDAEGNSQYGIGATPVEGLQPPDLSVDVMGVQYAWIFTYPNMGIVSGELHVPVGTDVQLNIAAQDVIHSLWLPDFRIKQDAIPGQKSQLRFVATKTGSYAIVCAELCGAYHGSMRTQIVVHDPEEFTSWVEENQIAQNPDLEQTIAVNSRELSDREFLSPYAERLGIDADSLAHLAHHEG